MFPYTDEENNWITGRDILVTYHVKINNFLI